MTAIDWLARGVESEVSYSVARGGTPTEHPNFIHVSNPAVRLCGDYNRVVGMRVDDLESFAEVVRQVEEIHREKGLERPDSYDPYPSVAGDGAWLERLSEIGHSFWTDVFFRTETVADELPRGFEWTPMGEDEYIDWYEARARSGGYSDDEAHRMTFPFERGFIRVDRPYWLLKDGERVAWVHCANLGEYFRLFDVETDEAQRRRGYGRVLLQAVKLEARSQGVPHILIRCGERLRPFYEGCGFVECGKGSVIRLANEA